MNAAALLLLVLVTTLSPPSSSSSSAAARQPASYDHDSRGVSVNNKPKLDNRHLLELVNQQSGKASATERDDETKSEKDAKSKMLLLKKLLYEIGVDYTNNRKRTCRFNLGGHCATEEAASMANQWHFLNSALSPGRRRRSALTPDALKRMTSSRLQRQSRQHPSSRLNRT